MKRGAYELTVDYFAGAGGATQGIEDAISRPVDIAINHDPSAIAMHAANHPKTTHLAEDVWMISPERVTGGRPVGLAWFSPDCKHFSRAKGGKPVEKSIRSLAWVVIKWAIKSPPRVIILENVREFEDWGPLVPRWCCASCDWRGTEGQATLVRKRRRCPHCNSTALKQTVELIPDQSRKGLTFKRFVGRLRNLGYQVAWKVLNADDYGAPTHRRRLFLVARNDGERIVWPEPTHCDPKKLDLTPLFGRLKPWRTAASCIDWSLPCPSIFDRERPLAEKTMRRIAMGIKRYVLDNPRPFIVRCNHGGEHFRGQSVECPICTLTAARDAHGLVTPYLVPRYGEAPGQAPRASRVDEPLRTVTQDANCGMLISPLLVGAGGSEYAAKPRPVDAPAGVIKCDNHAGLVAAFLAKHYGGVVGVPVDTPVPTTTERGTQNQLTVANLIRFNHDDAGVPIHGPMPTITTNNHAALVYSFLVKYFGTAIGQAVDAPMHTATGKHRFGVVTVTIEVEPYVIVDIGMRMLRPRELARGQGFPNTYVLTGTATNQVAKIGNSVPPDLARAIVAANYKPRRVRVLAVAGGAR